MARNLWDNEYFRYAGTCRHCGRKEEWVVEKRGDREWASMATCCQGYSKGFFLAHCKDCQNQAIFDLTAVQAEGPPECLVDTETTRED